jgi:hypothetical protein
MCLIRLFRNKKTLTVNGREVLKVIAISLPFNKACEFIIFDLLPILKMCNIEEYFRRGSDVI